MNAEQFCAEYGYETKSGRVSFSKKTVDKFIKTYTDLLPEDFTESMRERLKIGVMIDLYSAGCSKHYIDAYKDFPVEKIDLPEFIFK
ncbi:hypothetical protein PDL71_15315 [Lacibacter sp. MH-610]|uniref:hypothetical protein n=1 Tax=Lacibacter sp. MH-610 TaxID=3020883 RepID=UPI00389142BB